MIRPLRPRRPVSRPSTLALLLALACGCGGAPELRPDGSELITVGVDPVAVIDEATSRLATHGLSPTLRVEDPRFSTASFAAEDGRSALRVATRRGVALAIDATPEDAATLSLDPRTGTDLDADGAGDVVIVRTEPARSCFALAIVDTDGVFRPVGTDARGLDPRGCIENLVDLDHDGRVEALVPTRAPALGDPPPSISEPLTLREDGAFARGPWPEGFARDELARREAVLEVAIERGDVPTALRLAIELAWIVRARGGDVAAVDEQLAQSSRVALAPEHAERLQAARQFLLAAVPSPPDTPSSASASASD